MTPWLMRVCIAAGMVLALAPHTQAGDAISTSTFTVVDGNRLFVDGQVVRLAGIVAPELGRKCMLGGKQRDCGVIARAGLSDLTAGATIVCSKAADVDGAPAHRCTAGGYDVSEGMVYTGWAVPLDGAPEAYWRALKGAQDRPRGFWRGEFVTPWPPAVHASSKR